ncbi:MAG: hypothetical protein Tsb0020_55000 [Haliangiales bacterium]
MRSAIAIGVVVCTALWCLVSPSAAVAQTPSQEQVKANMRALHRDAIKRYDDFEFEAARDALREAVALAAEHGLEEDPLLARIFADLAVVYLSGLGDQAGARRALMRAVEINPEIAIDPAYKSPELDAMLDELRSQGGASGAQAGAAPPDGGSGAGGDPAGAPTSDPEGLEDPLAPRADRVGTPKRLFVSLGAGTAGAFVTGNTEQVGNEIQGGVAPELAHTRVELGVFLSEHASASAEVRVGFPIGADLPGHAIVAPAGLLRLRYWLAPDASGLRLSFALGGGYVRHTVELTSGAQTGGIDTAAAGPLLTGGSVGYAIPIGDTVRISLDSDVLFGVPVVARFAGARTVFGVHASAQASLLLGF